MPTYPIRAAADLLGVSVDTVRRALDAGALTAVGEPSTGPGHRGGTTPARRRHVDGGSLARYARSNAVPAPDRSQVARSARNRFVGLVTRVVVDGVMAQVEIQCGPHRVVSLMSREAVEELALEPGSLAVAVVKATSVLVETPGGAA